MCDYCGLQDPTEGQSEALGRDGTALPSRKQARRIWVIATAVVSSVVLVGAMVAYLVYRTSSAAPACAAQSVTNGGLGVILDNAVRDLPPDIAAQVKNTNMYGLESVRADQPDHLAQGRSCAAIFVIKPGQAALSFVSGYLEGTRMVTNDRLSDRDMKFGTQVLQEVWHASAQRMELPITYSIVADDDGTTKGWAVDVNPTDVQRVRALIMLIAPSPRSVLPAPGESR